MFLTVLGFILASVVGFCLWWVYGRMILLSSKYRYRYSKLPGLGRLSSPTRRSRGVMPTLLRRVSFKEDEESAHVTETSFELYSRRD